MQGKTCVSSAIKYDCFKLNDRLNEVIPHWTRSVNCRLCLQHFNEYHAYEYSLMNKSINKVLADL